MDEGFYRAFEDRYRGEREDILQRLQAYEPFTLPFVQAESIEAELPKALDIGCGRGEWLELLQQQGFAVQGVDLDDGMLASCHERQLPAVQGDGIVYLAEQPADSLSVVSAFHVVEHIPFEAVATVAREALRALKEGGVIILETPNPENLLVASRDFYLDPSHQKPIPPQLLAFVLEYAGFERVKIVRLNESAYMRTPEANLSLWDVISGVSPDYAVIAQKGGSTALTQQLDAAFEQDYGVSIDTLASRYQIRNQFHLNNVLDQAKLMNEYRVDEIQRQTEDFQRHVEDFQQLRQEYNDLAEEFHSYRGLVKRLLGKIRLSIKNRLRIPVHFVRLQVRRVREKGLKACLKRVPYKLGWWRISQRFNKQTPTVMPGAIPDSKQPIHPKDWHIESPNQSNQSPLEHWNRERD